MENVDPTFSSIFLNYGFAWDGIIEGGMSKLVNARIFDYALNIGGAMETAKALTSHINIPKDDHIHVERVPT